METLVVWLMVQVLQWLQWIQSTTTADHPQTSLTLGAVQQLKKLQKHSKSSFQIEAVKGIFVNIFGGIMKCDVIAEGVIAAAKEVGLQVPLVVRLEGTNVDKGKALLNESGLNIIAADSMADGAQKIVELVG